MKKSTRSNPAQELRVFALFLLAGLLFSWNGLGMAVKDRTGRQNQEYVAPPTILWLQGGDLDEGLYELEQWQTLEDAYEAAGLHDVVDPQTATLYPQPFTTVDLESSAKETAKSVFEPAAATIFFQPIPINRANKEALMSIDGIGKVLAGRIINLREKRGGFTSPEELLEVRGIGAKKLASIREKITFD